VSEAALPPALRQALQRVRDDREHGASWLAREAARALAEASVPAAGDPAGRLSALWEAARLFAVARPSMAALANTVARIWAAAVAADMPGNPGARLASLHAAALQHEAAWSEAARAIGAVAGPLLHGTLYLHSRSGTVEQVLLGLDAAPEGQPRHAIVSESRPGGEGVVLARVLAAAGWTITLVADAACGLLVPQAGAVLLGADSVRADGSLVNKIGSHPLALSARAAGVPVYVLCETLKIAAADFSLHMEEMDPRELLPDAVPGITPRNPYFDHTPAELISAVVTEAGVLTREAIAAQAAAAAGALAALQVP
jgi:translation initiation factor 2B subunit (eIF-2B alpha/beta/delta family)